MSSREQVYNRLMGRLQALVPVSNRKPPAISSRSSARFIALLLAPSVSNVLRPSHRTLPPPAPTPEADGRSVLPVLEPLRHTALGARPCRWPRPPASPPHPCALRQTPPTRGLQPPAWPIALRRRPVHGKVMRDDQLWRDQVHVDSLVPPWCLRDWWRSHTTRQFLYS